MSKIPNFRLDPCSACKKRYDITDINNINSCVVETAAAFAGESSLNALIGTSAGKACEDCLTESKHALGKSNCVLRLTNSPVWTQTPHFFPYLFSQSGNKESAFQSCLEQCKDTTYPRECTAKCQTDADAVVLGEPFGFRGKIIKQPGMQNAEVIEEEERKQKRNFLRGDPIIEGFNNKCAGDSCNKSRTWSYVIWGLVLLVVIISLVILWKKR